MLSPRSLVALLLMGIGLISAAQATPPRYKLVELPVTARTFLPAAFDAQGRLVGTLYGHEPVEPISSRAVRVHQGRYQAVLNDDQVAPFRLSISGMSATGDLVGNLNLTRQDARHSVSRGYALVDGALSPLIGPAGNTAVPMSINRSRQVVGYLVSPEGPSRSTPFSWHDGLWQSLPVPDGHTDSWALALNDRGQVVGSAHHPASDQMVGILWEGGAVSATFALPEYEQTWATAINRKGWVVGTAYSLRWGGAVFVYRDGVVRAIGPGGPRPSCTSKITGINASGEVAMSLCKSRHGTGAGLYSNGEFHWFKRMLPASQAHWDIRWVHAINDEGDVAASAFNMVTSSLETVILRRRH